MRKIDFVRDFFERERDSLGDYAKVLYRKYYALTPKKKRVSLPTFVKWAPDFVKKVRVREAVGGGIWATHTILELGEPNE